MLTAMLLLHGGFIELLHHETHTGGRFHQLEPHDCGAHERHVPIDDVHPCFACIQSSTHQSVLPTVPAITCIHSARIQLCDETQCPHRISLLNKNPRSPPLATA